MIISQEKYLSLMSLLKSLKQIKLYKSKPLTVQTHRQLSNTLKKFTPSSAYDSLGYNFVFDPTEISFVLQKMNRIGWIADEMDHHPEWTLRQGSLNIRLSTHDIGNKVSAKDYILALWIEKILDQQSLEKQLCDSWNEKGKILEALI